MGDLGGQTILHKGIRYIYLMMGGANLVGVVNVIANELGKQSFYIFYEANDSFYLCKAYFFMKLDACFIIYWGIGGKLPESFLHSPIFSNIN